MARVQTSPHAVLESFVLKLREHFGLQESHCYETIDPDLVSIPPGGEFFLSVAMGEGVFPDEMQIGGGIQQCTEMMTVIVTVYNRSYLDPTNIDRARLHDEEAGLLKLKREVLKALIAQDLTDADENTFLRQLVPVVSATKPQFDVTKQLSFLSLNFRAEFDWDLTS